MVREFSLFLGIVGSMLFCAGLFSEYHFFIIIGITFCSVAMLLEDIYLNKK